MNLTTLTYELAENDIVIITIDVKDRPMNILTPELHQDIALVAEQLSNDDKVKGAIIQSGKSAFVAGGDLKRIVGLYDLNRSPTEAYLQSRVFTEALRKLETCGKPVACTINGAALGGGLELALACHYRIAVDDPKVPLGLPETSVGLIPGAGGTQRLPRLIGIKAAADLILSGSHISPQEALKLGMVDQLISKDKLLSEAIHWVSEEGQSEQAWDKRGFQIPGGSTLNNPKIAKLYQDLITRVAIESRYNYPAPIAALESIFNGTTVSSFNEALKIETRAFSKLTRDPVSRNMMRTLFLNKGLADGLHKRPAEIEKVKISRLAILGESVECESLAYASAIAGIEVFIVNEDNKNNPSIKNYAERQLAQRVESGKTSPEKADSILALIKTDSDKILAQVDVLIVSAIVDSKRLAEQLANIGENTLTLVASTKVSMKEVCTMLPDPKRVIGWHIDCPADLARSSEIVVSANTNDETLAQVLDFTQQLRKTPVVQKDNSSLFSQACILSYLEEGLRMLSEGISPILIENIARDTGMRIAPLEWIDKLSLSSVYDLLNEDSEHRKILKSMLDEHDRTGKTNGAGFYTYGANDDKKIWRQLTDHFPEKAQQANVEELKQRFLSIQSLKAISYCESKLIEIIDTDIASVLICGFPSYTGGVLSYIDTMGIKCFIKQCEQLASQYGERYKVPNWILEQAKISDRIYAKAA